MRWILSRFELILWYAINLSASEPLAKHPTFLLRSVKKFIVQFSQEYTFLFSLRLCACISTQDGRQIHLDYTHWEYATFMSLIRMFSRRWKASSWPWLGKVSVFPHTSPSRTKPSVGARCYAVVSLRAVEMINVYIWLLGCLCARMDLGLGWCVCVCMRIFPSRPSLTALGNIPSTQPNAIAHPISWASVRFFGFLARTF